MSWIMDTQGLDMFHWKAQPAAVKPTIDWLTAWGKFRFNLGDRPLPILFIWGPFGTGKSELSKAIARFMHLNLGVKTVEMVYWPEWVSDQLNGNHLKPDWQAHLLILDDLDKGQRPIPKSMDTWLLGKIVGILKPRAEIHKRPTIITTNRGPNELEKYFSTNSLGESNEETRHAAQHIVSALQRHTFAEIYMKSLPVSDKITERNSYLRQMALTQDLSQFSFPFLEEIKW